MEFDSSGNDLAWGHSVILLLVRRLSYQAPGKSRQRRWRTPGRSEIAGRACVAGPLRYTPGRPELEIAARLENGETQDMQSQSQKELEIAARPENGETQDMQSQSPKELEIAARLENGETQDMQSQSQKN